MPGGVVALVAALLGAGVAMAGLARPVLRRLPEPVDGDGKVAYADLPTPRFVATCTVLALLGVALAWLTLPVPVLPMWWVLAVPVLLLTAVDARTTWMPPPLNWWSWWAMVLAALGSAALGGGWALLVRAGVGAAVAGTVYLLAWRISDGGIGFGDVRLAPLLGAAAAAVGWPTLVATLVLGSLAGAAHGIGLLLRRDRRPYAYAPGMLAGAYLACLLRATTGVG